jgi:hypothetical protein
MTTNAIKSDAASAVDETVNPAADTGYADAEADVPTRADRPNGADVPTSADEPKTDPDPEAAAEQPPAANPPVKHEPLLSAEDQQGFLDRWSAVQVGFVDDPTAAVQSAETLIEDIAAAYSAAFDARRAELATWRPGDQDTESLRLALQRYRSFIGVILPK